MDTITSGVLNAVSSTLEEAYSDMGLINVHTITIVLNGQHGGAEVTISGEAPTTEYQPVTITTVVH